MSARLQNMTSNDSGNGFARLPPAPNLPGPQKFYEMVDFGYVLPLTYTVDGVRQALGSVQSSNIVLGVFVLIAFILVFAFPAVRLLAKKFA